MAAPQAPGTIELDRLREGGFSIDEIGEWTVNKRAELGKAGFSEQEIDQDYFGYKTFNPKPLMQFGKANKARVTKPVKDFGEAWSAGWGWGTASLGAQALTGGVLPDQQVTADTPWHLRAVSNVATLANDIPAMAAGSLAGGLPGAFAMPAGLRPIFINAIENGEIKSTSEFVDLATTAMWETTKGWVTGQAVGFAGAAAAMPASSSALMRIGVPTTAEMAAMVTTSKALEGELPQLQDFEDGALILFGFKGAHVGASKLRNIWAKTGVPPDKLVELAQTDPQAWQDILSDKEVPAKLGPLVANGIEPVMPPTVDVKATTEPKLTPEAEARALAYFENPFGDRVPVGASEPQRPTHMNYSTIDTPEAVKDSLAKLSEVYETEIQTQRRGEVAWDQTYSEATKVLADLMGTTEAKVSRNLERAPGTPAGAAELYARKELATGAAEELLRRRQALVAKGTDATPQDKAEFLAQVEMTGGIVSQFLGARAETGRALNILKSTKRDASQAAALKELFDQYGGEGNIDKLVKNLGDLTDPAQVLKFAEKATKATTYEMLIEAYRAGLISGVTTAQVNVISTAAFSASRIPVRVVAAVYGKLHGGDKVTFGENIGAVVGIGRGVADAATVTWSAAKTGLITAKDKGPIAAGRELLSTIDKGSDAISGKTSDGQRRGAIPGPLGEVVRAPFMALSLPDLFLKTLNQRSELYALATRKALADGHGFGSPEFSKAVADTIADPPAAMLEAANTAGLRNTFNAPAGPKSAAAGQLIKEWHLEMVVPFRRTVGNIFKESARMTPGLNLAVSEWRADFAAGGARRDMALAEVTVGTALMGAVYLAAQNGNITGGGSPDPAKRATDAAAGWKPYSAKLGDKYYPGFQRMAPYGQMIGMAADLSEIKDYMSKEEHDRLLQMIGTAFARNVTNQSFMTGVANAIAVTNDPARYGGQYIESLAGSVVPSLVGQIARERDPLDREINGALEAIRSRIPGMREGLMPKRDIFGEEIKAPEKLWYGSPFSVSAVPDDKVRTEASRIGFATSAPPKSIAPGEGLGDRDKVALTPAQRDVFASEAGKLAHEVLAPFVNSPDWDETPQRVKHQFYQRAFAKAREYGSAMALTPEERGEAVETAVARIVQELANER